MQLRKYQIEAKDAVLSELIFENRHSTLLEMATGSGKTITFAHVINDFVKAGKRVLVIAHRDELIEQAYAKISDITGLDNFQISIEKSDNHANLFSRIIIASIQSLKGERLRFWRRNHFSLIVIDEAHHTPATGYVNLLKHFNTAKVLGVTATIDRLDKKGLSKYYDSIAYVYPLDKGIQEGFLSPIISKRVIVKSLNLNNVRKIRGDFIEKDLERELVQKPTLYEVAYPTVQLSENRPTLIFTVTVLHAKQLSEVINSIKPGSADYLSGKDTIDRRKEVLNGFRRGKIQFLCNCLLFTEGVDLPFVSCISCARPTQSRALYSQMVGRGSRIFKDKENCLVIDFTDNSESHKLICTEDILRDEDDYLDESVDNVFEEKKEEKKPEEQKFDSKERKENEEDEDIEETLSQERARAEKKEEVQFNTKEVDPFKVLGIYLRKSKFIMFHPSDKQKAYLEKNGLWREDLTRRQAAMICMKIAQRAKAGLCSPKQSMLLVKYGFDPNSSRTLASIIIDELHRSNFQMTGELRAKKKMQENKESWEKSIR